MTENIAVIVAVKIKICVICEIKIGILIRYCLILYVKLIIITESVNNLNFFFSGEAVSDRDDGFQL